MSVFCTINTRFVWHGMNIDIAKWCRSCKGCQTAKISRSNVGTCVSPFGLVRASPTFDERCNFTTPSSLTNSFIVSCVSEPLEAWICHCHLQPLTLQAANCYRNSRRVWMKMTWSRWKIKENYHVLVNQFHGIFILKRLVMGEFKMML